MSPLPQELFDAIIDEIHDKETLKACALVGSSFLPPSQRKLFRKVRLGGSSGLGRRSRNTAAALAESPTKRYSPKTVSQHVTPVMSGVSLSRAKHKSLQASIRRLNSVFHVPLAHTYTKS
jgi:hypothetical protein